MACATKTKTIDAATPRERLWAAEMIRLRNATQAALAAGYTYSYANDRCATWMGPNSPKPWLRDYVLEVWRKQEAEAIAEARKTIDQEMIDAAWCLEQATDLYYSALSRMSRDKAGNVITGQDGKPLLALDERTVAKALELIGRNRLVGAFTSSR